jgi:hypothetical protein
MYSYNGRFVEVIDGDTLLLYIDLGFYVWTMAAVRLTGIDLSTESSPIDLAREENAVKWLEKRLADIDQVQLDTHKSEDGSITCDIILEGRTVNQDLERLGLLRGSARALGLVH